MKPKFILEALREVVQAHADNGHSCPGPENIAKAIAFAVKAAKSALEGRLPRPEELPNTIDAAMEELVSFGSYNVLLEDEGGAIDVKLLTPDGKVVGSIMDTGTTLPGERIRKMLEPLVLQAWRDGYDEPRRKEGA